MSQVTGLISRDDIFGKR